MQINQQVLRKAFLCVESLKAREGVGSGCSWRVEEVRPVLRARPGCGGNPPGFWGAECGEMARGQT